MEDKWIQITKVLNNINGSKKKPSQWRRVSKMQVCTYAKYALTKLLFKSWIDYKALVKRQFCALVAYHRGNWVKDEPPRIIDEMDLEVAQFISNLPPECLEYDVYELNENVKKKLLKTNGKNKAAAVVSAKCSCVNVCVCV